jgi:flavin reductase (DIM6/NTAB) family NADH-FMN oxidoreductase RutF
VERTAIAVETLVLRSYHIWRRQWFLLAAGDLAAGEYNCMTVAWGAVGSMWDRPLAMVAVKPSRYTCSLLERFPSFTLCHFPAACKKKLLYLGTTSGREVDKIAASGLTPIPSSRVGAPGFAEADLIIECETRYADDYEPEKSRRATLEDGSRSQHDHRLFFGEIQAVFGTAEYVAG